MVKQTYKMMSSIDENSFNFTTTDSTLENVVKNINDWQEKCLNFWDFFYALLLMADYNLIIKNPILTEYVDENIHFQGNTVDLNSNKNYITQIRTIFNQTQSFIIADELYAIPQNFIYLKIVDDTEHNNENSKIILYYPVLEEKKEESGSGSGEKVTIQLKEVELPFKIFTSESRSENFEKNYEKLNIENINLYKTIISSETMNLRPAGISFISTKKQQNNHWLSTDNNDEILLDSSSSAFLSADDINNIKTNLVQLTTLLNITSLKTGSISLTKNYLTYPLKTMNITQSYDGSESHNSHLVGTPKDYCIDDNGGEESAQPIYCPCDEMIVIRHRGESSSDGATSAIWLKSTSPVQLANGQSDYITIEFIHSNDLANIPNQKIFKRGELMFHTGDDGADGKHIHMAVGLGAPKDISMCWTSKTINGKTIWVNDTTNGPIKPEEAFFIDSNFTSVSSSNGLSFKKINEEKEGEDE